MYGKFAARLHLILLLPVFIRKFRFLFKTCYESDGCLYNKEMLFWHRKKAHKNTDYGNNNREKSRCYIDPLHQKGNEYYKIKQRSRDYPSTLNDIKVVVFPDRFEIKKLNIKVPVSSLNSYSKGVLIRRIIGEISKTTGIPENDILVLKYS